MIPSGLEFLILSLAAFRVFRIISQDDMPVMVRWRNAFVGAELEAGVWAFRHPTLAHFIGCAWCLGFWIALAISAAWWLAPHWTIVACLPFAVSAAVGVAGHFLTA